MDNNPEILTPKNKSRSLGLKRSIQKRTTPLSDIKVDYKSLQNDTASSPSTPCLSQKLQPRTSAYTTNCLPYKLSLSRRVRDKYKKKKLEFVGSIPDGEAKSEDGTCRTEEESLADILQQIITKELLLKSHQNHKDKVQDLKSAINIWKEAFRASLDELSAKIDPKMEAEDLIARLGIPPEMIDYTFSNDS